MQAEMQWSAAALVGGSNRSSLGHLRLMVVEYIGLAFPQAYTCFFWSFYFVVSLRNIQNILRSFQYQLPKLSLNYCHVECSQRPDLSFVGIFGNAKYLYLSQVKLLSKPRYM